MTENIKTSIGEINIKKAGIEDEEAVLTIVRDATNWLEGKGIPQWTAYLSENGRRFVQKRIKNDVVYLASFQGEIIGTVAILWEDPSIWEVKGSDGLAGYIHSLAILRRFEGKQVGKDILRWAMDTIRTQRSFIRLDCMAENVRLCRYYEEMGFAPVGQKTFPNGWLDKLYERN
ncbi:MAG TPA: GNAT family N-acetyltransferase [bacterium]